LRIWWKSVPAESLEWRQSSEDSKRLRRIHCGFSRRSAEAVGDPQDDEYQIPTFTLNGNLISFAAYKNHIGVYPAPRDVPEFKRELAAYKGNKSTLQLPLDKPIPVDLISRIVKYQLMRTQKQAVAKGK
jgi:uncharacterized protein YdhG (YjbR/CyaY superfamily)